MACFTFGVARRWVAGAALATIALGTADAAAQLNLRSPQQKPPKTVKLVLHPAPEPRPALRYELLPNAVDLKPGNAAVMYNKIGMQIAEPHLAEVVGQVEKLLEDPPEEFDGQQARQLLPRLGGVFADLELAATRQHCNWELPIRETENFFAMLLPELQKTRTFARLLAIRARAQIEEGRFDDAIRTLRTGYALGRHVAEGPTLIHALVGIAICKMMSQEVQRLVQQPEVPNLYWALAEMPRPLIDIHRALSMESQMLYLLVPELKEIDDAQHSPAYWDQLLEKLARKWGDLNGPPQTWKMRLAMTALALKGYPQTRQGLIDWGYRAERVDAMPVPQVVTLFTVRTYEDLRDEMFKWFALPYPQARQGLLRAERVLCDDTRRREILPVASLLLPAVGASALASARCDRNIAVLRAIEALRMYASDHAGELPERLADVTEAPVPLNPITGGPFGYRREGRTAVLDVLGPSDDPSNGHGLRLEIEMRPRPQQKGTSSAAAAPATQTFRRKAS